MNKKFTNKVDCQAYIDGVLQSCEFVEFIDGNTEIECHLDVDLVLSEKVSFDSEKKKQDSHKNHTQIKAKSHNIHHKKHYNSTHPAHIISQPRREKLIMNLNEEYERDKTVLGGLVNFIFA